MNWYKQLKAGVICYRGGHDNDYARCIVQSAVLRSHVVCLSVCDVGRLWSHRLEILETRPNCADNLCSLR